MKIKTTQLISGLVLLFSAIALISSLYLSFLHYFPHSGFITCTFSEKINCDIVTNSIYSEILGVPLAVLGALTYLCIFILALRLRKNNVNLDVACPALFLTSLFLILMTAYLIFVSSVLIGAYCIFCIVTYVTNLGIAGSVLLHRHQHPEHYRSLFKPLSDPFILNLLGFFLGIVVLYLLVLFF